MLIVVLAFFLGYLAIVTKIRGRFFKHSLVLSFLGLGVFAIAYFEATYCKPYMCGLAYGLGGGAVASILVLVGIILALFRQK